MASNDHADVVSQTSIAMSASQIDDGTAYLASKVKASRSGAIPDRIRSRNRRKRYLERHPEYFGSQLELADPLLYDRLIRRFQTTAERESEGRKKGYSGVLEADIVRSEAKVAALQNPDPNSDIVYKRGTNGEILAEDRDEVPRNKEEGYRQWKYVMERRFIDGRDQDFDYTKVDDAEELDDGEEERDFEERWFDAQSPEWTDVDNAVEERELKGETGVQDF